MTRFNPVLARAELAAKGYRPSKIVQFTGPLRGAPKDIRDADLAIDDHGYVIKDRLGLHAARDPGRARRGAARGVVNVPVRRKLRLGEVFAGIGGWGLGLERTGGFETVWSCERDAFCRRVLAKHWPLVPCFPDIRNLRGRCDGRVEYRDPSTGVRYLGGRVDVLAGGSPCQDLSVAGNGAGIHGERSGLWFEYLRLIGELRPRYAFLENVPALRTRGLHTVLEGLAAIGYDAEWDGIPASAVGAHHQRDRIWLVAYPQRSELRQQPGRGGWSNRTDPALPPVDGEARVVAYAEQAGLEGHGTVPGESEVTQPGHGGFSVAHGRSDEGQTQSDVGLLVDGLPIRLAGPRWVEPNIPRTAEGVPNRKERLSALGNANVPQISQWLGQRVLEYEASAGR